MHSHPSSVGLLASTKIRVDVKEKASSQIFTSAQAIVNDVLIEQVHPNMPLDSLLQPTALARVANRHRHRLRPEDPNTLDFTLSHEHLPTGFLQGDIIVDDYRH